MNWRNCLRVGLGAGQDFAPRQRRGLPLGDGVDRRRRARSASGRAWSSANCPCCAAVTNKVSAANRPAQARVFGQAADHRLRRDQLLCGGLQVGERQEQQPVAVEERAAIRAADVVEERRFGRASAR